MMIYIKHTITYIQQKKTWSADEREVRQRKGVLKTKFEFETFH